jgi:hypothetical protein
MVCLKPFTEEFPVAACILALAVSSGWQTDRMRVLAKTLLMQTVLSRGGLPSSAISKGKQPQRHRRRAHQRRIYSLQERVVSSIELSSSLSSLSSRER